MSSPPAPTPGTPPPASQPADVGPTPPSSELTAKQVRELRRLCRKTANRAEYDDRSVQVRQIASIVAMGAPSMAHFAPRWSAKSELQAWVDKVRHDGADWRDERILLPKAVEELRDWDRLLKVWAEARFGDGDMGGGAPGKEQKELAAVDKTPSRASVGERKKPFASTFAASPVSVNSPTGREIRTPAATRLHRVASGSMLGTPITPGGGAEAETPMAASRPKLVPAPSVSTSSQVLIYNDECSDSGGDDAHSAISSEGEEAAREDPVLRKDDGGRGGGKPIRRTMSERKPLGTLSISRTGNVINVELPAARIKRNPSRLMGASGNVDSENVIPTSMPGKSARETTSCLGVTGKMAAIGIKGSGAAAPCDRPRDWASLRARPLTTLDANKSPRG